MNYLRRYSASLALSVALGLSSFGLVNAQSESVSDEQASTTVPVESAEEGNQGVLFSGEIPKTVEQLQFMESHFAQLAKDVFPATVNIQMGGSQGSGVVVSDDGYVLTAAHVIGSRPGATALVTFMVDGKEKRILAETLGVQAGAVDSGMLKIKDGKDRFKGIDKDDRFEGDFPYVDIGTSQDLKLGQWVMAVGHPGGIDKARGLVVRVGRIIDNRKISLRTDCTLVGGDSGGPLFDMNGLVIGIHSRIGQTLADNLHVPADVYSEKWDLMSRGVVINGAGTLGFSVVEDTNEIEKVEPKGPAEVAGMKKGDVLIKMGKMTVEDKDGIKDAYKKLDIWPNSTLRLVVQRGDETKTLKLTVGVKGG
ncbi:MAG: S1C family serine protease [Mariniblastus sp.]|nr:S1C family serine protease [Mariniblastus sp.]